MIGRGLAAAVVATALTGVAAADATDRCIAESERGQRLVLQRAFVASRPHLVACGRAECPPAISRDCIERLRQAETSSASVVLSAGRTDGSDASDVRVFVDDDPTPRAPSGEALWLDPGPHRFRFERPGSAPVVRAVTIEEGARLQRIAATFEPPGADARAASAWRRRLAIGVAAGGAVAVATGAVFGLLARSHSASERDACASPSSCRDPVAARRDYDAATRDATVATVALVAGGALIATGLVLRLTAPSGRARGVGLAPTLGPRLAGLSLQGAF